MIELVLKADDPRIGKVTDTESNWPTTDVAGQPYQYKSATCYTLSPSPKGEHWFVVLPIGVSEFDISLEKVKKPVAQATKAVEAE